LTNFVQVKSMVMGEVSVTDLLKMSSDELADDATQGLRKAQREAEKKLSMVASHEEEVEARRREVMSMREEAWRGRDSSVPIRGIGFLASSHLETKDSADRNIDKEEMGGDVRDLKRPLEIDMVPSTDSSDGLISPRTKLSRLSSQDEGENSTTGIIVIPTSPLEPPQPAPKKPKGTSILDLIRSSSSDKSALPHVRSSSVENTPMEVVPSRRGQDDSDDEEIVIPLSPYVINPQRLINRDGGNEFSLQHIDSKMGLDVKFNFIANCIDRFHPS
jgi:hypothetical protein